MAGLSSISSIWISLSSGSAAFSFASDTGISSTAFITWSSYNMVDFVWPGRRCQTRPSDKLPAQNVPTTRGRQIVVFNADLIDWTATLSSDVLQPMAGSGCKLPVNDCKPPEEGN